MKSDSINRIFEILNNIAPNALLDKDVNASLEMDSIEKLMFFSALESDFNVSFDLEKFDDSTSIKDINDTIILLNGK